MKTVTYTATALRQLARINRADAERIRAKVRQYASDPASLANQVKTLQGVDGLRRLRVGDYRVVFTETGIVI